MADDRAPAHRGDHTPANSGRASAPVRRSGGVAATTGSVAPVHQGAGLSLADGLPGREECWTTLGPKVVARLNVLSGHTIEWYASRGPQASDGRAEAGVLGANGFSVALPRFNDERRPVYSIASFQFDPASHRQSPVQGFADSAPGQGGSARPGPGGTGAGAPVVRGLNDYTRGELGNLPARAQELLQAPFLNGDEILRSECWYEGYPDRLETYLLVLAGKQTVTAAVGGNYVPVGSRANAPNWTLMCHRFNVVRRIGQ